MTSQPSDGPTSDRNGLTARSEAHAVLAALIVLARAGDDVLCVGTPPPWLAGVAEVSRMRARGASVEEVFDAIGEHTAALLVLDAEDELLEALTALGPPVLSVGTAHREATVSIARALGHGVEVRCLGLDDRAAASLARTLALLSDA